MRKPKSTILIIDDDEALRSSLQSLLPTYGFTVVAFESPLQGLETIRASPPDVIILDVKMPDMDGLSVLQLVSEIAPQVPVIMLTGYGEVPAAVRAMKIGAHDFIEKPIDDAKLVDIINNAIRARSLQEQLSAPKDEATARFNSLSEREKTVALMVADGYSSAAIAATLNISIRTVEHHRASILAKMKATSLPQLLKLLLAIDNSRLV